MLKFTKGEKRKKKKNQIKCPLRRRLKIARELASAVSEHAHNTGHKPLWKKLSLLIVTLITTRAESRRQFI